MERFLHLWFLVCVNMVLLHTLFNVEFSVQCVTVGYHSSW